MGKKVGNVEIDGQVDGRFTSYYDADKHGAAAKGETVAGTTADDEGEVTMDHWPSAVDADPEDLTETQERIIRAAARYPDAHPNDLADAADCHRVTVYSALREKWPERYDQLTASTPSLGESGFESGLSEREVRDLRRRLLDGETARDLTDEFGVNRTVLADYAAGRKIVNPDYPPPLEYDKSRQEWQPVDGEDDTIIGDWPAEIECDPDDLTDKQAAIIRAAAGDPGATAYELASRVDTSQSYAYTVLRDNWPERLNRGIESAEEVEPQTTTDTDDGQPTGGAESDPDPDLKTDDIIEKYSQSPADHEAHEHDETPAGVILPEGTVTELVRICAVAERVGGDAEELAGLIREVLPEVEEVDYVE